MYQCVISVCHIYCVFVLRMFSWRFLCVSVTCSAHWCVVYLCCVHVRMSACTYDMYTYNMHVIVWVNAHWGALWECYCCCCCCSKCTVGVWQQICMCTCMCAWMLLYRCRRYSWERRRLSSVILTLTLALCKSTPYISRRLAVSR